MATTGTKRTIDLYRRFRPFGTQRAFLLSDAKYRLYSSGYGGGKSKTGCRESIHSALAFPGSRHLVARLHYPDLRDTTVVTFWRECEQIGLRGGADYSFNRSDNLVSWTNGSQTLFRNLDDQEKFGSLEVSTIFVDEGSEVPDSVYQVLFPSRLRWHLPGCEFADKIDAMVEAGQDPSALRCACPLRAWICTNPGASGYLRAVTQGKMPTTGAGRWQWFAAKPGENPYNGADYHAEMQRLGAIYGKVWLARYVNGDWSAFEGQRFAGVWNEAEHVLPVDFKPDPALHEIYEGWDFGFRGDTHVAWLAVHPGDEEPVICFADLAVNETEPKDIAGRVKRMRADFGLHPRRIYSWGDPAGVNRDSKGRSYIDEYVALGIYIAPCRAGKSPVWRADHLAKFLAQRKVTRDGIVPGIVFNPRCAATIRSVTDLRWKEHSSRLGEDPREVFLDRNKHGFDGLSYGLTAVPPPRPGPPPVKVAPGVNVGAGPRGPMK